MHTATGTMTPHAGALHQATTNRKHAQQHENTAHTTAAAALRGASVGALIGVAIFGILLSIAGVSLFELRYTALYLCGIAMCTAGGSAIAALWHAGAAEE